MLEENELKINLPLPNVAWWVEEKYLSIFYFIFPPLFDLKILIERCKGIVINQVCN